MKDLTTQEQSIYDLISQEVPNLQIGMPINEVLTIIYDHIINLKHAKGEKDEQSN